MVFSLSSKTLIFEYRADSCMVGLGSAFKKVGLRLNVVPEFREGLFNLEKLL